MMPENFRLTKTTEIEKDIATEAEHYRLVAKKFLCLLPQLQ